MAGVISSSNFPHNYRSYSTCIWKITVESANHIKLNFTDFDLENNSRCEHAYVRVYDGLNTTDPSLGTFCGSEIPAGVRSSGNQMLVVFQASRGDNFKGFRAFYDSGECYRQMGLHYFQQRHFLIIRRNYFFAQTISSYFVRVTGLPSPSVEASVRAKPFIRKHVSRSALSFFKQMKVIFVAKILHEDSI